MVEGAEAGGPSSVLLLLFVRISVVYHGWPAKPEEADGGAEVENERWTEKGTERANEIG